MTDKPLPLSDHLGSGILRPSFRALALESRLLFDGAGADAVFDIFAATAAAADWEQAPDQVLISPQAIVTEPALLVIDAAVAGYETLLDRLPANIVLRVVARDESGIAAVGAALRDAADSGQAFSAIHVLSHGDAGTVFLGSDVLSLANLSGHEQALASWQPWLGKTADILFYGCDVAVNVEGKLLIASVAALTGADVAASVDATGGGLSAANWTLEAQTGPIEAALPFSRSGLALFTDLLAAVAIDDANAATVRITPEDTERGIAGISVAGAADDVVTLRVTAQGGTVTLTLIAGVSLVTPETLGTADFSVRGRIVDINTALSDLRFNPAPNQNSSVAAYVARVDLAITDGGIGSRSVTNLSVTAVNDAPSFATQSALALNEGGFANLSLLQLAASAAQLDPDIATGQQQLTQLMMVITSLPSHGTLTYQGGTVAPGVVVPVSNLGSLRYTHNGTDLVAISSDSFAVTVSDGGGGQTAGTIQLQIAPRNEAPTISGNPSLLEGQVKRVAPTIQLGDDFDTLATATIVIDMVNNGDQGTLFFDGNDNSVVDDGEAITGARTLSSAEAAAIATRLKFRQDGTEPNQPGVSAPGFRIGVTDAGGGTGQAAMTTVFIALQVQPNNDDPTLINSHAFGSSALEVNERVGATLPVILTNTMLQVSDPDRWWLDTNQFTPSRQLVYSIEQRPQEGEIQLYVGNNAGYASDGWVTLGNGGRFTQGDINEGRVRFYQTTLLASDTTDSFTFKVRDSAFGYDVLTNPELPVPDREGGVRDTPTGPIALQQFFLQIRAQDGDPVYGGGPRAATPGNGTDSYSYDRGSMSNGNGAIVWNEANVGAVNGAQVLTENMLRYVITRTSSTPQGDVSVLIPPEETIYTINSQPQNGTLQQLVGAQWSAIPLFAQFTQSDISLGRIRFVHDGSESHTSEFGYRVSDGTANNFASSFSLDITPVNDRPTVAGGSAQVTEGAGNSVRLESAVLGMADVDQSADVNKRSGEGAADFLWLRLNTLPAAGQVQRWDGNAWVALDATGLWLPRSLLSTGADGGSSGLRYVHDGSEPLAYAGGPQVQFTYVVRDDLADPGSPFATSTAAVANSDGSAQSNLSTASTVTISVIPVNQAPAIANRPGDPDPVISATITAGGALTGINDVLADVREGAEVLITAASLQAVDTDNTTVQRQFRITQVPTLGVLLRDGRIVGVGSTFTQKDIDDGLLKYRHGGSEVGERTNDSLGSWNDKFHFIVSDGTLEDAGDSGSNNVFLITLVPGNDKPTLSVPAAPVDVVASGSAKTAITGISLADLDLVQVLAGSEEDFVRVELQIIDAADQLVASAQIDYSGSTPASSARSFVNGRNSNLLVLQGSLGEVQAALNTLQLGFVNDENSSTHKLRVTVDDRLYDSSGVLTAGTNGGVTAGVNADGSSVDAINNRVTRDIQLFVSNANNAPSLANASVYSVLEDVILLLNGFTFSDADSFTRPVTVQVELFQDAARTVRADPADARLTTLAGLAGVTAEGLGDARVILSGAATNVLEVLNQMRLDRTANYNGELYLRTTLTDFGHADFPDGRSATVDNDVTVVPVNDVPVLTVPSARTMNSGTFIDITSGFSVQDAADTTFGGDDYVEVTLTARNSGLLYGKLLIQDTSNVSVDDNDSATVVVKGSFSAVSTALNSLRYSPDEPNVDRTIVVTVEANDLENGKETIGVGGNNLRSATFNIRISGSNDAPVVTVPGIFSTAEDSSNNNVTGVSYADADDFGGQQRITVAVAKGTVDFGTKTGLSVVGGAYNSASVTVAGTKTALNNALATLRYTPIANYHGSDTLTVTADDRGLTGAGGALTDSKTIAITVTPVNDRPIATLDVTLPAIAEDLTDAANPGVRFDSLNLGYSDATDNQTAAGGGNTASANSYFAIVANAATAQQGVWQVGDGSGGWITVPTVLSTGSALIFPVERHLRFSPALDYFGTPGSLSVRLSDASVALSTSASAVELRNLSVVGEGSWNDTNRRVSGSVTGINDAPQRTSASVTAFGVAEDAADPPGQTVASLFAGVFSDARDGSQATAFAGVAVTAHVLDKGRWEYHSGLGWQVLPEDIAVGNSFVLKASDQLRFRSTTSDYNGTPADLLTVRLIDSSQGAPLSGARPDLDGGLSGGTTPYSDSANAVTLGATVMPRNDAPTFAAQSTVTATEVTGVTGSGDAINVALLTNVVIDDPDLGTTAALNPTIFGAGTVSVTLSDPLAGDLLTPAVLTGVAASSYNAVTGVLSLNLQADITLTQLKEVLEGIRFLHRSDDPTALASGSPRTTRSFVVSLNDGNNSQSGGSAGGPEALTAILPGTITLIALDDPPVAGNDSISIVEDTVAVNGSLLDNDNDPDSPRNALSVPQIQAAGGSAQTVVPGSTSVVGGTLVTGKYGTLLLGADGSYRYTLDNDNPVVNGLGTGDALTDEIFVYTLTDGASSTTASLTVTINGMTDGAPSIVANDGNGASAGQGTVAEAGLLSSADSSEIFHGTLSLVAQDGITAVEVGGELLTRTQLRELATTPRVVNSARGQLVLLGFDSSSAIGGVSTAGTLQYRYTLSTAVSHSGGQVVDSFSLLLRARTGATSSSSLDILVQDDAPLAANDSITLFKQAGSISATVAGNDSIGADGPSAPAGGYTSKINEAGSYGFLALAASGSYTYTVDPTNPAVAGLAAPATLVDAFTYTLTDSDGSARTATLSITIRSNTAPSAVADVRSAPEDQAVSGNVLDNDSDADGNALSLTGFRVQEVDYGAGATATLSGIGTITVGSDGSFTFTPTADWNGTVPPIQYTLSDGTGLANATSTATLSITVTPVVDIADDSASTLVNTAVTTSVLANDSFAATPVVTAVTAGSRGSTTRNPDNTVTYTPEAGFIGSDSYTYTVSSGGVSETATVTVQVRNTPPQAQPDSAILPEDSSVSGNVLANDSDADGQPLRVIALEVGGSTQSIAPGGSLSVSLPGQGQLTLASDGAFTFTPLPDWHGSVAPLSYTVSDGSGASNGTASATLSLVVTAVADTVADDVETPVNKSVTTSVLANDTFRGTPTVTAVTAGSRGSTTRNPDNTVTYTPEAGFIGSDSYTYTVSSGGVSETGLVRVQVGNSPPRLQADGAILPEDSSVSGNVLANDSDADGQPLRVIALEVGGSTQSIAPGSSLSVSLPGQGQLTLASDGAFTFTPLPDWHGSVVPLSYTVSDGSGASNGTASATLELTVTPVVDIAGDSASTLVNTAVTTAVLANDSFAATPVVTAVTAGSRGSTTRNSDNTVTYTPQAGFIGADSYSYTVSSGGVTETATVTVEVRNTPPQAQPDNASLPEDGSVSGNVLANDSDADGQPLRVIALAVGGSTQSIAPGSSLSVSLPGQGQLTLASDGAFTFTPLPDWHGSVAPLAYSVSDGSGASNGMASASLGFTVTPVADIQDDRVSTNAGAAVRVDVLRNDSFQGQPEVSTVTPGSKGSTSIAADNSILYTPEPGFDGEDSFSYTVSSGGVTETATVSVEVLSTFVPSAPTAPEAGGRPGAATLLQDPAGSSRLSPVTMDAGVFAGEWRPDTVLLLPLPANPAIFVTREIVDAQNEARRTEARMFSQPDFVMPGQLASRSLGSNLGILLGQFVLSEVRSTQEQAFFQDLVVGGRFSRIQLSSDGLLGTPSLFQPLVSLLQETTDSPEAPADSVPSTPPREAGLVPVPVDETRIMPDAEATPAAGPVAAASPTRAASFNEQLLTAAARRPLALRAAPPR